MKSLFTLLLCCLGGLTLTAQSADTFTASPVELENPRALDMLFTDYQTLQLSTEILLPYLRAGGQTPTLQLTENMTWSLELTPSGIVDERYRLTKIGSEGRVTDTTLPDVLPYEGALANAPGTRVRLTFNTQFIYGYVNTGTEMRFIEPLQQFVPEAPMDSYVLYRAADVRPDANHHCGVTRMQEEVDRPGHPSSNSRMANLEVEYAIASDFSQYAQLGGTIGAATNFAVGVTNNVEGDYQQQFANTYNFVIVENFVSTCPACDPWTDSTDPSSLLADFRTWANNGGFNAPGYDVASLWTNRNFDGPTIGLASLSAVCTQFRYNVLENFSNDAASTRALVSHELGHNFGATHNYEGTCLRPNNARFIMDPSVSASATSWTNGGEACLTKGTTTVAEVNNFVNSGAECLTPFAASACGEVTGLMLNNITANSFTVSWNAVAGASNYRVRVREEGAANYFANQTTGATSLTVGGISRCATYEVVINTNCGGGATSDLVTGLFDTAFDTDIRLLNTTIAGCSPAPGGSTYDLQLTIGHNGGNASGFNVLVNGTTTNFSFAGSPQTVTISGLTGDGTADNPISISAAVNGGGECDAGTTFDEPTADCSYALLSADFNSCERPNGWTDASTNNLGFADPFEWKYLGTNRPTVNYPSNTFDGTCMAYLDDDINNSTAFTGEVTLQTPVLDVTQFTNLELSFIYNFHNFEDFKGANASEFNVDVFNGNNWVNILSDDTDVCIFNNIWNAACYDTPILELDAYRNANFQLRFRYTDGGNGAYTGMIALDDIELTGTLNAALLPVELTTYAGSATETGNRLTWTTAQELNADYFALERSTDGGTFSRIGRVAAAGNSSTPIDYTFMDIAPAAGTNYYRLLQYDFDGRRYDHGTVSLSSRAAGGLRVMPNPIEGQALRFAYTASAEGELDAELFDPTGRRLQTRNFRASEGINTWNWNLDDLAAGVYLLRVRQASGVTTQRFTIR